MIESNLNQVHISNLNAKKAAQVAAKHPKGSTRVVRIDECTEVHTKRHDLTDDQVRENFHSKYKKPIFYVDENGKERVR
jgi:hypothetical protein